jgi:hypothetical protein
MGKSREKSEAPGGAAGKTEREQRLARALRDNLLRRKAQARAKAEGGSDGDPGTGNSAKGKRSG